MSTLLYLDYHEVVRFRTRFDSFTSPLELERVFPSPSYTSYTLMSFGEGRSLYTIAVTLDLEP